jgi:hypothetical protein
MPSIDPHFPRLITRRAAENLVNENGGPSDEERVVDFTNVVRVSETYARALQKDWPKLRIENDSAEWVV